MKKKNLEIDVSYDIWYSIFQSPDGAINVKSVMQCRCSSETGSVFMIQKNIQEKLCVVS